MENKTDLTDALAHCLEALESGEMPVDECLDSYPQHRAELTTLLDKWTAIRSLPLESPRADFRKKGHQALLNAILARQPETFTDRLGRIFQGLAIRRQPKFNMIRVVGAAVLVFLLMSGGAAYASDTAVPGDLLYGLDRALEQVRLKMAADPEAAAALHLANAEERLSEFEDQAAAGDIEDAQKALENYGQEIAALAALISGTEGFDPDAQERLISATQSIHQKVLTEVLDKVPLQAKQAIQRAIDSAEKPLEDIPGVPDDAGKPEDAGKPVDAGKPEGAGKPEDTGKPEDAGKPDEMELPDNQGEEIPVDVPDHGEKP